jgi:hypothetical protein
MLSHTAYMSRERMSLRQLLSYSRVTFSDIPPPTASKYTEGARSKCKAVRQVANSIHLAQRPDSQQIDAVYRQVRLTSSM